MESAGNFTGGIRHRLGGGDGPNVHPPRPGAYDPGVVTDIARVCGRSGNCLESTARSYDRKSHGLLAVTGGIGLAHDFLRPLLFSRIKKEKIHSRDYFRR